MSQTGSPSVGGIQEGARKTSLMFLGLLFKIVTGSKAGGFGLLFLSRCRTIIKFIRYWLLTGQFWAYYSLPVLVLLLQPVDAHMPSQEVCLEPPVPVDRVSDANGMFFRWCYSWLKNVRIKFSKQDKTSFRVSANFS